MSFTDFNFHHHIFEDLQSHGYVSPTPIQKMAIPPILAGRDIVGLAQTGTGKTAAFILPILQRLSSKPANHAVQALIVAPTRELAEQTHTYTGRFAKRLGLRSCAIYGGVSRQTQIQRLRRGAQIVVACPGRLLDLARDGAIDLSEIDTLVLDEADQMLDRGFLPDIKRIIGMLPAPRQNLVFSATMPHEVRSLVTGMLVNPVEVTADHTKPVTSISHTFYKVEKQHKNLLLDSILLEEDITAAIVFTRTKHKARSLARRLEKQGFNAVSIQGNLSQNMRQRALDGFRAGTYDILVATDIAARGIDVAGISHIINYDMPGTTEAYTHRIGRTGRAHRAGEALTFITDEDGKMTENLQRNLRERLVYKDFVLGRAAGAAREMPGARHHRPAHIDPARAPRKTRGKRSAQRKRMARFDFGIS